MEGATVKSTGHSADVRIQLAVNGSSFAVAQLGPGFVVLRDQFDSPPSIAKITMSIDGELSSWPVELIDGIVAANQITRIRGIPTQLNGHSAE